MNLQTFIFGLASLLWFYLLSLSQNEASITSFPLIGF